MTDFDNEETLPLESEDAPEQGYEEPDAPTLETPVGVPSEDVDELDEDLLIEPLHEAEGSVLGLDQEGVEGVPDLYQDLDLPPSDEEWDELPETPELSESYEVENEYEELLNLGEETFEIEEFGPVASSSSILHYEIQARTYEEQPWETIALVNPEDEMLEVADLPVGETWSFRIRTVFTNGESSAWSAPSPVIFPPDMLAPGIPSTPVVVGNAAGIGVTWDGLDESGRPMPPDFARVIIWQSPTGEAGTFERRASIPGAMEAILTGYSANEPHYFAFTAMDFAGNESGFSQIATGYRIPLTDVEELKAELERLDQTDADLTEAVEGAEDALGALADRQAEAETEIEAAKDRITGAESTLGPLSGDVDKAKQEAEAARQAAEAAEARVVEAMANMQSVLANGSFESGLDGWTAQNAVSPTEHGVYISETVARSGERSLALSKQWDFVVYGSPVHVTPGETWELSGFYYCNIGPSVSISIDYLGEGGQNLGSRVTQSRDGAPGVWHSFNSIRLEVPEGAVDMSIAIMRTSTEGTTYVDDISLRNVTDTIRLEKAASEARAKAEEALQAVGQLGNTLTSVDDRLTDARALIDYNHEAALIEIERARAQLPNLVPVGDFEGTIEDTRRTVTTRSEHWSIVEVDDAYQGRKVLRYEHKANYMSGFDPLGFEVSCGRTYRVRFAARLVKGAIGNGEAGFSQRWQRPSGVIWSDKADSAVWGSEQFTSKLTSEWTVFEGDVSPRVDIARMFPRFLFEINSVEVGTIIDFDGLAITDVTELKELERVAAEAAETAYLDRLVVREGFVTPEAVIERLFTDIIEANVLRVNEAIAEELIARNATLISAAIKNLTVTEKADFVEALVEQLFADEFTARVAQLSRAIVAARNLYGNADFADMSILSQRWERVTRNGRPALESLSDGSFRSVYDTSEVGLVPVTPGDRLLLSAITETSSTAGRVGISVQARAADGSTVGGVTSVVNGTFGAPAEVTGEYEVANDPKITHVALQFWRRDVPAGAYAWISGVKVANMLDGQLLVDGTIKSRHIENTGDILTEGLKARKIQGIDIDGDTFAGNTFRGGLFEGVVVQGSTVQTNAAPSRGVKINNDGLVGFDSGGNVKVRVGANNGALYSNGGEISGGTVTGALIQTSGTTNRGIKLDANGLRAYSNTGRQTVTISSTTGDTTLDGGNLIAADINAIRAQIGPRYISGVTGSAGVNIDNQGRIYRYNNDGALDTRIDGANNMFTGELRSSSDLGNSIRLGPNLFRGRPAIRFTTGNSSQIQPTIQSLGAGSDGFPAGAFVLNGRETTANSSGRSDLVLSHGGNFELKQNHGTNSGVGILKESSYIHVRGRTSNTQTSNDQVVQGSTGGGSLNSSTAMLAWNVTYGAPSRTGTRQVLVTPHYSAGTSGSGHYAAKAGVGYMRAGGHRATLAERTAGTTWSYLYEARWV